MTSRCFVRDKVAVHVIGINDRCQPIADIALHLKMNIQGLLRLNGLSNLDHTIRWLHLDTTISAFNTLKKATMLGLFNTVM
jgi:hypothetical protein